MQHRLQRRARMPCRKTSSLILILALRPTIPPSTWQQGEKEAPQAMLCHSRKRECNSMCARGRLLKSLTSLPYGSIKWEADYRKGSFLLDLLSRYRLPTTQGSVGWGNSDCGRGKYACSSQKPGERRGILLRAHAGKAKLTPQHDAQPAVGRCPL